jgi:SpoIID/LytB domain protein
LSHDATPMSRAAPWLLATATAGFVIAACRTVPANAPRGTALAVPSSWSQVSRGLPSVPAPAVRVGILVGGARASIAADSGVEIWLRRAGGSPPEHVHLSRATFESASDGRVSLVETGETATVALVAPSAPSEFLASQAQTYRGFMEVHPATGATLTVVNVVNVEDYIRGVVPNELSSGALASVEALKAQAVAARTYARAHLGDYSSKGFDLCATAACQVYKGAASEHPLSDRAVAETRGVLATWHGRPIRAYYTSACGGHTESGRAVFDDDAPYLRGVACVPDGRAARWSVESERAAHEDAWEVRLTPAEVRSTVARFGSVGKVLDLVPLRSGVSGRVVVLAVVGAERDMLLRGVKVRWGLGVPESLFVIARETAPDGAVERFVIKGLGHGHGVGLCQTGAAAMARAGAGFRAILEHYYPGITLSEGV